MLEVSLKGDFISRSGDGVGTEGDIRENRGEVGVVDR